MATTDARGPCPSLLPQERQALGAVGESRLKEFAWGRACARRALLALGEPPMAISRMGRAPVWPPGVVGSISHCPGLTVAMVGRLSEYRALGVDVERRDDIDIRIADFIASQAEQDAFARWLGPLDGLAALWSAKESIFKAVDTAVDIGLGFLDVELSPCENAQGFAIAASQKHLPGWATTGRGRVALTEDFVLSTFIGKY